MNTRSGTAAAYNHGISSLALSELYGTTERDQAERLRAAIAKSLRATLEMQRWPKDRAVDEGGWRYLNDFNQEDSDLSVTGWELKFLRSARNAGFDVPKPAIDAAVAYVRRTYSPRYGAFGYAAGDYHDFRSRGMAGAGILALAHAGFHNAPEAKHSGEWILQNNFDDYNADRELSCAAGPTTATTTDCSIAVRGCTNSAANIGSSFSPAWCKRCSPTSSPTAPGRPRAIFTTASSAIATRRRWCC